MKRYIRSGIDWSQYGNRPYPYDSDKYRERVEESIEKIRQREEGYGSNIRDIVEFNGVIFVIFERPDVDMYVVDDWGHCGQVYDDPWESMQKFVKYGGDINLVTYTDSAGYTYAPIKNRKSILVTAPDGRQMTLPRAQVEGMYAY